MAVQTQIQTRRGTAATWTSTNPTLAAGEIGFETDTNKFKIGTGSTAWTALAYAANTSPLTTKGDLYTYSTDNTRLAVGNNGESLVADSATTTGLRYQATSSAGKNAVINGGFDVWQRGTSISLAASTAATYTTDRFQSSSGASQANTISRQSTNDTTNLPNIQYCARIQRNSGQTGTSAIPFVSSMETANCIPYAGKAIVYSFYARAGSNFSSASNALTVYLISGTGTDQNRLTAAYTGETLAVNTTATLTTTWQRFTYTATLPTNCSEFASFFQFTPSGTAGTNDYFEVTGVQIELGSVATSFSRAAATIQGELAACQRYYEKSYDITTAPGTNTTSGAFYITQSSDAGANSVYNTRYKVEKRNTSYSIAYYTTAGTATKWTYTRSGVAATDSVITNLYSGTSGLSAYTSVGAAWTSNQMVGHWVVDNEL